MKPDARKYPENEERLNVLTHGLGFLLSIVALVVLVVSAVRYGSVWHVVSFSIYGSSLVMLYFSSMAFHMARDRKTRNLLNAFDHASIFFLIAGTYTPFLLVTLNGPWGWSFFGVVWGVALVGIILKFFFAGRFNTLSTIIYIAMGWIIVIAIKPLVEAFPFEGLMWLLAGGLSYTVGAAFFLWEKIPYNHAVFHVFVLLGSFCHFVAVYFYVLG